MSRPRIPTSIHELKGSFRKNPKRGAERALEPQASGDLVPPPAFLRTDLSEYPRLLAIWNETVAVCWWLTAAEGPPLESYCRLKDKERRSVAKGPDLTNLFKLYPILGMTQDGRARFRDRGEQDPAKSPRRQASEFEDMLEESQRLRAV